MIRLEWKDPKDAEEIAELLEAEGRRLKDRGFLEDARTIRRQIEERSSPEGENPGEKFPITTEETA